MKKKIFLIFTLVMSVSIYATNFKSNTPIFYGDYNKTYLYGITEKNIDIVENELNSNNRVTLLYDYNDATGGEIILLQIGENVKFENIDDVKKVEINEKPYKKLDLDDQKSNINYKKGKNSLVLSFSTVGEYMISFFNEKRDVKEITIKKIGDSKLIFENLMSNMNEAYQNKNIDFLNKNILIYESFFPNSSAIKKMLFYAIELNQQIKNYEEVRKISKTLVSNYHLNSKNRKIIIAVYLDALNQLNAVNEKLTFLKKLSLYDKKYEKQYMYSAFKDKKQTYRVVEIAEKEVLRSPDKILLDYIANYYYKIGNYVKAGIYYKKLFRFQKLTDYKKLAVIYLSSKDKTKLIKLKAKLSSKQLNNVKEIETQFLKVEKIEKFRKTAKKYVKKGDLYKAEIYYKQILVMDITPRKKNATCLKLVDLYYNLNDYTKAEKILNTINPTLLNYEELGEYYYLYGILYYNLEQFNISLDYFNKLVQKYPFTSLSNKGNIYISTITKLMKKN